MLGEPLYFTFILLRMKRPYWGSILMWAGALLGVTIGVLGVVLPGGSLNWFVHAPSAVIGLPLSLALIASGAVVRRLDQSAPRALSPNEVTRLMREADALVEAKLAERGPRRRA